MTRYVATFVFMAGIQFSIDASAEPASMADAIDAGSPLWETTAKVRVRSIPHERGRVVARMAKGTPLVVLIERGDWFKILGERGKKGWVEAALLRKVSTGTTPKATGTTPKATGTTPKAAPPKADTPSEAQPEKEPTPALPDDPKQPLSPQQPKPIAASKPHEGPPPTPTPTADRFVTPMDFCAQATVQRKDKFVRQKLVVFRLAAASGATIKGPGSGQCLEHAAELFQAVFPLKRFDNIVSPSHAPAALRAKGSVDFSAIQNEVRTSNPFVSYSLRCTDYVAVPILTECVGEWKTVKDKKGRTRKVYDAKVEAQLVIWRRKGDTLVHHVTIDADAPTIANRASDIAQAAQASVAQATAQVGGAAKLLGLLDPLKAAEIVAHISPAPSSTCMATAGKVGDDACKVSVENRIVFAQPISELRQCYSDPPKTDAERIRCGVRNRAEQLAFNLQKEARSVEGWRLWAQMKMADGSPTICLGDAEGVYVGEVFHAVRRKSDGSRVKLGHTKAVKVGAGGDDGDSDPTQLRWRVGDADGGGVIMEEHPQLGLAVGLAGQMNTLLVPVFNAEPSSNRFFDPGTFYSGASLQVGYDLSGVIGWTEFWLTTHMAFVMSPGEAMSTMLFDIQVFAEKRFYLGRRLDWFFGIGPSMVTAVLGLKKIEGVPEDTSVTAFTIGLAAETGFDLVLTADLYLRLGVMWRQHFKPIEEFTLENEQIWKPSPGPDGEAFSTTYSGMAVHLGAGWVF